MRFLERWLATVVLALALPGFVLPGNLGFTCCVCAPMRNASGERAQLASCCVSRCCEARDEQGPTAKDAHQRCAGCRDFTTQRRDSATPTSSSTDAPLAMLPVPAKSRAFVFANDFAALHGLRPTARAAPVRPPPLPLRI